MTVVKKRIPKKSTATGPAPRERTKKTVVASNLVLPTKRTEVATEITEQITLIYGEPGIGKSSLLSEFPDTVHLMFEPGAKNISIYKLPPDNEETGKKKPCFEDWREFQPWVDVLCNDDTFKNVVFDTTEWAYRRAVEHVCDENGWDHVSEAGYAKGYDRADEEFSKQVGKLTAAGKGVFFVSHVKSQQFSRPNGTVYDRLMPNLTNRGHAFIVGLCDIIMYYGYTGPNGTERRLFVGGNDFILTKCKPEHNLFTTSGERVVTIPMGDSHEESYDNLMDAWDNLQEDPGSISRTIDPTKRLTKVKIKK